MLSYKHRGMINIAVGAFCLLLTAPFLIGESQSVFSKIAGISMAIFNIVYGIYFRRMTEEQYDAYYKKNTKSQQQQKTADIVGGLVGILFMPVSAVVIVVSYLIYTMFK